MLLSKEIAVELNLAACKLKQYTSSKLKQSHVDLTPEQFLVIDMLWNQGPMSQQRMADTIHKDKNSVTKLVDALEKKVLSHAGRTGMTAGQTPFSPQKNHFRSRTLQKRREYRCWTAFWMVLARRNSEIC